MLIDIEITCNHKGSIATHLLYLLQDKACALYSCFLTLVVKMKVEHVEFPLGVFILEMCPGADATLAGIPTNRTSSLGSFREPEVALVKTLYTILFVEDGSILALGVTIIATNSNKVIILQALAQVLQLRVQHLLHG